jgi:CHASE1-domain containing sensor protein
MVCVHGSALWLRTPRPSGQRLEVTAATFFNRTLAMNTEKFESHQEGWRSLWLAIAGVIAIMLIWNVVMLSLNGISY